MVLALLFLSAAGCMSIPGPENTAKTPAITLAVTTPAYTPVTPQKTRIPATPKPITVTTMQAQGYETSSCASQGGFIVSAGQQCSAAYLPATDSFSCCAKKPVPAASGNVTAAGAANSSSTTITGFDLSLDLDDDPGSITP